MRRVTIASPNAKMYDFALFPGSAYLIRLDSVLHYTKHAAALNDPAFIDWVKACAINLCAI